MLSVVFLCSGIWRSFVSNSVSSFNNTSALSTDHIAASTGTSWTRGDEGQLEDAMVPSTIHQTCTVPCTMRTQGYAPMETSKLTFCFIFLINNAVSSLSLFLSLVVRIFIVMLVTQSADIIFVTTRPVRVSMRQTHEISVSRTALTVPSLMGHTISGHQFMMFEKWRTRNAWHRH